MMLSLNDLTRAFFESNLERFIGGKSSYAAVVSGPVSGSSVINPAPGRSVAVYWVYALTDPDSEVSPLITISLGGSAIYTGYAISHWELFKGAPDEEVTVTVSEAAEVAVTIHYKEF